jgi:mannose-6-phosphate isomerase
MLSKLEPTFTYKIWGGTKLSEIKNHKSDIPLGETWEISTHADGPSLIGSGPLNKICELSYLVKFIDTSDNLSVQVHPGDEYAKEHENEMGKTECWIILDSVAGAGIYLGFKDGITRKEFKTAIENNLNVQNYLNFFPTKPGDYFYVPFGAVHAIGSGVTLCEVQQSSGITYRVWDWNRVDDKGVSRELHVDKAMDVLNFSNEFNKKLKKLKNIFENSGLQKVVEHPDFKADILTLEKGQSKELNLSEKEGLAILVGQLDIDGNQYNSFDCAITLKSSLSKITAKEKSIILLVRE